MKNTNLADLVNEIEPIKAENKELRALVMSQQKMMNGMNVLLYSILHSSGVGGGDAASYDGETSSNINIPTDTHIEANASILPITELDENVLIVIMRMVIPPAINE